MPNYSSFTHWALQQWMPQLPPGRIDAVYMHWSAHDYQSVFPAYHFCVVLDANAQPVVVQTNDLRINMRNVREAPEQPYAAHTRGRNSWAAGLAVAAMRDATPSDFGRFPLTRAQLDGLVRVAAAVAEFYGIEPSAIRTHAEAALEDGYFGAGEDERWDIARTAASPLPLDPSEAASTGDWFRERIAELLERA